MTLARRDGDGACACAPPQRAARVLRLQERRWCRGGCRGGGVYLSLRRVPLRALQARCNRCVLSDNLDVRA